MKKRSRLGLACKIVAVVYFAMNILVGVGNVLMTAFGYGAWVSVNVWLGIGLLAQLVAAFVPSLSLWGIGVLLDRQKQDRQLLERLAQPAQEPEAETLEGVISVDDLESLDGPDQER